MHILVDGDVVAYRAAFSAEGLQKEDATDKIDGILSDIRFYAGSPDMNIMEVFLTGKGNFRTKIDPSYKANRKDTPKPTHLKVVRDYLVKGWSAVVSKGEEADDLIAIRAAQLDYKCVVVSTDKDFKQLPCSHFNPTNGVKTTTSNWDATFFFYTQVLTGDRVDNIPGITGIGPVKAARALSECATEEDLYNKVLSMYEGDEGLVLKTARLLWLRRKEGELWLPPNQR